MKITLIKTKKAERLIFVIQKLAKENQILNVKEISVIEQDYDIPVYEINIKPTNQWKILGIINHAAKLVYNFNSKESLESYLSTCRCDSCNTLRYRTKTYIIESEEKQQTIQVGTNCLQKYIGFGEKFWEYLAELTEYAAKLKEGDEEYERYRGEYRFYSLKEVIERAIIFIENWGYISKRKEWDGLGISTSNLILSSFGPNGHKAFENLKWDENIITDKANKVIKYFTNDFIPEKFDDFQKNIKRIFDNIEKGHTLYAEHIPILGYTPVLYDKLNAEQHIIELKNESNWVGEIGQRVDEELIFIGKNGYMGSFGYVNFYRFKDKDGNTLVWKSTKVQYFTVGDSYTLKYTINAHETFNGEKQTMISRAKIL